MSNRPTEQWAEEEFPNLMSLLKANIDHAVDGRIPERDRHAFARHTMIVLRDQLRVHNWKKEQ